MGALRISVGTSIATQQAPSIGNSIVTLAVISVTSTMPVTGARKAPVKKAAMPTTANAFGCIQGEGGSGPAQSDLCKHAGRPWSGERENIERARKYGEHRGAYSSSC